MREYLLVLFVAMATTFLLTGVARQIALRYGAVAKVRTRDVHKVPIPYFGGVSILAGLIAGFAVASNLPFLGDSLQVAHDARAILVGGVVICAVGVIDDLYELDAITKLAGQVLAVGVMVVQGIQLYWLPLPGGIFSPPPAQLAVLTAGILLVSTNAVNFVDGLDGLAAGVTAIGAGAFFTYSYLLNVEQNLDRATTSTLITVALAGACLGFLPHNFFPARVFMGDSGALLIGLMLAASTISLTGQMDPNAVPYEVGGSSLLPALLPLILPIAVLAIPALDLTMAYVRRTKAGRSPFAADKLHLHHRLMQRGHSHRRAVLLMYLWTFLISFGVVVLGLQLKWWTALLVLAVAVTAILLTTGLPRRAGRTLSKV
ncbi:glycosyltransferase family 4 protein [Kribbella sp. CA-293567]|uniref:glycosyltransferase family 4 protein n=1 Tax=Kribbella sp. CA-293567 TaxID=3002436 RepID=UPI0022DD61F6|nr:MraY family glycosyltransferase [Kribbella sp. CA-293567]WBQ07405.1 MraY family glycosyltransferase [Kribbella sp. CA-293567]